MVVSAACAMYGCAAQPPGEAPFALAAGSYGEVDIPASARSPAKLARAFDGSVGSRWTTETAVAPGFFLEIAFPEPQKVAALTLDAGPWREDVLAAYTVETSLDGVNWEEVAAGKGTAGVTHVKFNKPRLARRVIIIAEEATSRWWSVAELKVVYADE